MQKLNKNTVKPKKAAGEKVLFIARAASFPPTSHGANYRGESARIAGSTTAGIVLSV